MRRLVLVLLWLVVIGLAAALLALLVELAS